MTFAKSYIFVMSCNNWTYSNSAPAKTARILNRITTPHCCLDLTNRHKKPLYKYCYLDNYIIHSSKTTRRAVEKFNGGIVLHFLPPYCPDDNNIERCVWRELLANVTRNHRCRDMDELMREIRRYLARLNRPTAAKRRRKVA